MATDNQSWCFSFERRQTDRHVDRLNEKQYDRSMYTTVDNSSPTLFESVDLFRIFVKNVPRYFT